MADGENYSERFGSHFDLETWARGHDKADDFRFSIVWRVFGVTAAVILAVLGWSMKAQYESAAATQQTVKDTETAIIASLNRQTQHFDQEK